MLQTTEKNRVIVETFGLNVCISENVRNNFRDGTSDHSRRHESEYNNYHDYHNYISNMASQPYL